MGVSCAHRAIDSNGDLTAARRFIPSLWLQAAERALRRPGWWQAVLLAPQLCPRPPPSSAHGLPPALPMHCSRPRPRPRPSCRKKSVLFGMLGSSSARFLDHAGRASELLVSRLCAALLSMRGAPGSLVLRVLRSPFLCVSVRAPSRHVCGSFLLWFSLAGSSENQLLGLLITFTSGFFQYFQLLPLFPY